MLFNPILQRVSIIRKFTSYQAMLLLSQQAQNRLHAAIDCSPPGSSSGVLRQEHGVGCHISPSPATIFYLNFLPSDLTITAVKELSGSWLPFLQMALSQPIGLANLLKCHLYHIGGV